MCAAYRIATGSETAITLQASRIGAIAAYRGVGIPTAETGTWRALGDIFPPFALPAFALSGPFSCIAAHFYTNAGSGTPSVSAGSGYTLDVAFTGSLVSGSTTRFGFAWEHNLMAPGTTTSPLNESYSTHYDYWGQAVAVPSGGGGLTMLV